MSETLFETAVISETSGKTVELAIYESGCQMFYTQPWREGLTSLTVEEAMARSAEHNLPCTTWRNDDTALTSINLTHEAVAMLNYLFHKNGMEIDKILDQFLSKPNE